MIVTRDDVQFQFPLGWCFKDTLVDFDLEKVYQPQGEDMSKTGDQLTLLYSDMTEILILFLSRVQRVHEGQQPHASFFQLLEDQRPACEESPQMHTSKCQQV